MLAQMRGRPLRWGVSGFWGQAVVAAGIGISAVLAAVVAGAVFLDMAWAAQRNDGSMFGGLFVGEKAIITLLLPSGASMWDDWRSDLSVALGLAPGSYAVVAGVVGLVMLFVFVLVWCRLGARACLARRRWCVKCAHDLTGQPIVGTPEKDAVLAVRCSECGTMQAVVRGWGEVRPQVGPGGEGGEAGPARLVYSPASGLVWRLWTRRRAMWLVVSAGALPLLGLATWGGVEVYERLKISREAAAARAAIWSDEQIIEYLNAGREPKVVPPGVELRTDAMYRIREMLLRFDERLEDPQLAELARQVTMAEEHFKLATAEEHRREDAARATRTGELAVEYVRLLREAGIDREIAKLPKTSLSPSRPLWITYLESFDPTIPGILDQFAARHIARTAAGLMRESVVHDDVASFSRYGSAIIAVVEQMLDRPLGRDFRTAIAIRELFRIHISWASRVRSSPQWLREIDGLARRMPRMNSRWPAENDVLLARQSLAKMLGSTANIRRGFRELDRDESIQQNSVLWPFYVPEEKDYRDGSFPECDAAFVRLGLDVVEVVDATPWVKRQAVRKTQEAVRKDDRALLPVASAWTWIDVCISVHEYNEALFRIDVIAIRLELFRAENGRLPTQEEFAAMFANDPDAQDPFVGGLLRYRVQEEAERTVDPDARSPRGMPVLKRGYVLYAVGPDGSDNGGTRPLNDWSVEDQKGFDVVLP